MRRGGRFLAAAAVAVLLVNGASGAGPPAWTTLRRRPRSHGRCVRRAVAPAETGVRPVAQGPGHFAGARRAGRAFGRPDDALRGDVGRPGLRRLRDRLRPLAGRPRAARERLPPARRLRGDRHAGDRRGRPDAVRGRRARPPARARARDRHRADGVAGPALRRSREGARLGSADARARARLRRDRLLLRRRAVRGQGRFRGRPEQGGLDLARRPGRERRRRRDLGLGRKRVEHEPRAPLRRHRQRLRGRQQHRAPISPRRPATARTSSRSRPT